MANRYAPFKSRYLTREPKRLITKFTHVGVENFDTSYPAPLRKGIYSIQCTGAGVYKFKFGAITTASSDTVNTAHTSSLVDHYTYLGPVNCTFSEDDMSYYVTNDAVQHATDPHVEITFENGTTPTNVTANVFVDILLLDSTD